MADTPPQQEVAPAAADFVAPSPGPVRRRRRRVIGAVAGGGAALAAIAGLSWLWRVRAPLEASAFDPVVKGLEAAKRTGPAARIEQVCKRAPACQCVTEASRTALDADLHAPTLKLVEAGRERCGLEVKGIEAEALARGRELEKAQKVAREALSARSNDPFALYAQAHVAWVNGDKAGTVDLARRAVDAGRGRSAQLLLALVAFHQRDYAGAEGPLKKMLEEDPDDVEALYNLALAGHHQNALREAREGYVKVLRLRPDHLDARFNLALLSHATGARADAMHHFRELASTAPPGDRRVAKLGELLRSPAPQPMPPPVGASSSAGPGAPPDTSARAGGAKSSP